MKSKLYRNCILIFIIFLFPLKNHAQLRICYAYHSTSLDETIDIKFGVKNSVSGQIIGDIHDARNSYYASYDGQFKGTIKGGKLYVKGSYEIEGDTQSFSQVWTISKNRKILIAEEKKFNSGKCK